MNALHPKNLAVIGFVLLAHVFLLYVLATVKTAPLALPKKVEPLTVKFVELPKPQPVTKPEPQPKPEPLPKPTPKPVVQPKVQPKPVTKPKPVVQPKPKPLPKPTPKPVTRSKPAFKPVAEPEPKPVKEDVPFVRDLPFDEQLEIAKSVEKAAPSATPETKPGPKQPTASESKPAPESAQAQSLAGNVNARFESKGMLEYPKRAQRRGLEGSVDLTFTIGLDGKAKNIKVVRSDNTAFNKAAINYVKSSRFVVQQVSGQAVAQPAKTTVQFVIN